MKSIKIILSILSALVLAIVVIVGWSQIDTGNVGVVKTGGQFDPEEQTPGWHYNLFGSVYEVSAKEQLIQFTDMRPKTSDQITVEDLDIDVYYMLNPSKAQEVMVKLAGDLATDSDGNYVPGFNYLSRAAREVVYDSTALTIKSNEAQQKRGELTAMVRDRLQKELDKQFGEGWFTVTNVNLRNLTVDSKLETKIREAAQVQYEIDTKVQQVKVAEAEADRQRAVAQGEADAATIRAKGLAATQGDQYLSWIELENQRMAIQKWNGVLPATVAGGAVPMIGIK